MYATYWDRLYRAECGGGGGGGGVISLLFALVDDDCCIPYGYPSDCGVNSSTSSSGTMVLSANAPSAALFVCRRFFKNQNRANNTTAAPSNPPITPPAMAPVLVDEETLLLSVAPAFNVGWDDVSPVSDEVEGDPPGVLSLPEDPLSLPVLLLPSLGDEGDAKAKHICMLSRISSKFVLEIHTSL